MTPTQGSHGDWKTWKMKMVVEKSWNMKNWPKVIEFCAQSWNFTNFANKLYQICIYLATTKKLSSDLESPHFPEVFRKTSRNAKSGRNMVVENQEMVMEKSWKNIFQVCGNPAMR